MRELDEVADKIEKFKQACSAAALDGEEGENTERLVKILTDILAALHEMKSHNSALEIEVDLLNLENQELTMEYSASIAEFKKLLRAYQLMELENVSLLQTFKSLLNGSLTLDEFKRIQEKYKQASKRALNENQPMVEDQEDCEVELAEMSDKDSKYIDYLSHQLENMASIDDLLNFWDE